ncbi:hypothetical protein [Pseudoalteromonas sp. NBT06-2]|uniref:hypothetical protein n=1 Tax=Pseudoalteromonas sp. NBT06-2 TaxID=2025950 RepID=UPI001140DFFF|nr:hypothetical protein [Pseudoalteromonas sp. NBT06-2]
MKAKEQNVFDLKWERFVQKFKIIRKTGNVSRDEKEQLIKDYDLKTTNGLITYKKLSDLLQKNNILTDREYKTTLIERGFLFMIRHHPRADVVVALATRFNVDINAMNQRLRALGYRHRTAIKLQNWHDEAKKMALNGDDYKTISDQVNKPTTLVIAFLRHEVDIELSEDFGVRGTKISYRNLQDKTIENSHLERIIWADGTVQAGNEVVIAICIDDQEYLRDLSFSLAVSGQGPKVSIIKTKSDSGRHSDKDRVGFTIARSSYANYLKSLGMPQNKEKTEFGFPEYIFNNTKFFWSFLRGFFEGDGTITKEQIGLCVNLEQANRLNIFLIQYVRFSGSVVADKSIFRLGFGSLPQVMLLIAGMYSVGGICMARKLERSKNCWNKNKEKYDININFEELTQLSDEDLQSKIFRPLQQKMKALKYTVEAKNIDTGEIFIGFKSDFVSKLGTKTSNVTRVEKGERKSVYGWKLTYSEKYS